ncbi:ABC transporter substrate-binding protein [Thermoflavimicrobium dichotomicum]|uniref:NitT/TauT family transport system substrate-binding protein n=1 Tax=Thermoflavimicrobium dichotomicum TaxID=46223 RepID=A0A1I3R872_9BACL|nr:ABC transporter substrate-binding protein [Thermoflavimicrobium dichotomicum]SFJ42528.1 NitT/TauT family transport system substrate-binding protein [Thermoflavimicrobium dichotomicum]
MKRKKSGFVFYFIISLLFSLIACSPSSNQSTSKIRLVEVTHSLFYTPQYIALTKGFFKEQGLEIELINGNGGDKTMTTLLANQSDMILMGTEGAIYVTARGANEPVMAFAQLTQTDGTFLLSRQPLASFTWDQLKGKKLLGQRRGGMPEMVSEYVQRKNGLRPHQDVEIIQNVEFQNLGTAFASGTGDFVQLFEPVASKLEQEGKGRIVASFGKDSGIVPYTVYMTKKSFLEKNPETVTRFVRALYQAQKWVQSHSTDEIVDAVTPHFKDIDRSILTSVIERYKSQASWAPDPFIDEKEYNHLLEIMKQAGELPKEVPYQQIVDTNISQRVIREQ